MLLKNKVFLIIKSVLSSQTSLIISIHTCRISSVILKYSLPVVLVSLNRVQVGLPAFPDSSFPIILLEKLTGVLVTFNSMYVIGLQD